MFKFIVLFFAALLAVATARPSVLASSPVVYSSHLVQPVVRAHYAVPVVRSSVVASPVVASPLVHSYGAVPVVRSYAPAYGVLKH